MSQKRQHKLLTALTSAAVLQQSPPCVELPCRGTEVAQEIPAPTKRQRAVLWHSCAHSIRRMPQHRLRRPRTSAGVWGAQRWQCELSECDLRRQSSVSMAAWRAGPVQGSSTSALRQGMSTSSRQPGRWPEEEESPDSWETSAVARSGCDRMAIMRCHGEWGGWGQIRLSQHEQPMQKDWQLQRMQSLLMTRAVAQLHRTQEFQGKHQLLTACLGRTQHKMRLHVADKAF